MSRAPRKKERSEADIQKGVLLRLSNRFYPGIAWRMNAGRVQTITGHWVDLGPEGIADVGVFVPCVPIDRPDALPFAVMCFVEVKRRTGKQREAQKRWQEAVERAGGVYVLARSEDQAEAGVIAGLRTRGLLPVAHA